MKSRDNQLILLICLQTGARVSDILNMRIGDLRLSQRVKIIEHKTKKTRVIYINKKIREEILNRSKLIKEDGYYAFPSRCNSARHRTRQTVAKDIKNARLLVGEKKIDQLSLCKKNLCKKIE